MTGFGISSQKCSLWLNPVCEVFLQNLWAIELNSKYLDSWSSFEITRKKISEYVQGDWEIETMCLSQFV